VSDAAPLPEHPEPPQENEGLRPARKLLDRGRLARFVALAGVLAVVLATKSFVLPQIPEDHDVELRLGSPGDVIGLDMRWSASGGDDIATTSLHFPPGAAPSSLVTKVHLPDGAYDVAIAVERPSGVDSTRRRVTLDSSARVTIPLR
jgi:hypothetical protein